MNDTALIEAMARSIHEARFDGPSGYQREPYPRTSVDDEYCNRLATAALTAYRQAQPAPAAVESLRMTLARCFTAMPERMAQADIYCGDNRLGTLWEFSEDLSRALLSRLATKPSEGEALPSAGSKPMRAVVQSREVSERSLGVQREVSSRAQLALAPPPPLAVEIERIDENHPILDAVLSVRRRNAGDFSDRSPHSGIRGEAKDKAILECYRAVEQALKDRAALAQPTEAKP